MNDTFDPLGTFKSFFFANDKSLPQSTRQKIALAMMMQKRKFPTTLGEGLGAIGESIGDIGTMRQLEREAASTEQNAKALDPQILGGAAPTPAIQRSSFAPIEDVPEEQTLRPPIAGAQPNLRPQPRSIAPGDLPPTGEPGNTGATTFAPPFQPPPRSWPTPGPIAAPQPYPPPEPPAALPAVPPPASPPALPQGPPPPPPGPPPMALPPERPAQGFEDRFSPAGTGRRSEGPPETLTGFAGGDQLTPPPPPTDARNAITQALMPKPPPPPTDAFAQVAQAPPPVIQPAPQDPSRQIRRAPVRPEDDPGYVPPERPVRKLPPLKTDLMQRIEDAVRNATPGDREGIQERYKQHYENETKKLQQLHDTYKSDLIEDRAYEAQRQEKLSTAAQRRSTFDKSVSEAETAREEARIVNRTGMKPTELYKRFDEYKDSVDQTIKAQSAQQLARKAIRDGVITGYGANMRIAGAKFADWAFKNGIQGDIAANTETMQAALSVGLSEAIKTVNGEGGAQVSNADVKIAQGMAGSDPNLQMKTIQSIMDRAAEINNRKINSYEEKVDRYLSGEKAEDNYRTGGSTIPPDKLKILLDGQNDPQTKKYFDQTYGPGAAELELARFKRAQRRKGKD